MWDGILGEKNGQQIETGDIPAERRREWEGKTFMDIYFSGDVVVKRFSARDEEEDDMYCDIRVKKSFTYFSITEHQVCEGVRLR